MLIALQVLLALALLAAWWASPILLVLPQTPFTNILGIGFAGFGLGLGLQAMSQLGKSFRVHPRPGSDSRLVTRGIYAVLRHPMYTAVVSMLVAVVVVSRDVYVMLLALMNILFYLIKSRYEERLLTERYPEYDAYRRRTFGVLPFRRG